MKVSFTKDEVLQLVLDYAHDALGIDLNTAEVDNYGSFESITLSWVTPEPAEPVEASK